jgi:6-phosphogluconolactonase
MNYSFLLVVLIFFSSLCSSQDKIYPMIIDTYVNSAISDGIYVYNFDGNTGDFKLRSKLAGEDRPSFVVSSRDGKYVYSINEISNGNVSAFKFNRDSAKLEFLNRVSTGGDSPCYVAVDKTKKFLFVGHYGSGTISVLSINADGSVGRIIQLIRNEGSSVDKRRQERPHVHSVVLSPDEKYLLSADVGTDRVNIFRFDPDNLTQPLTSETPAFISVEGGSGPRHLIFHPNSKYVYLTQEMAGAISVYDFKDGKLTEKQVITMLSPGFKGRIGAADIHITEDGRFIYASNRGDANEIVIYAVNTKDGRIELIGHQKSMGETPRNFTLDPTNNFLLVANQESNDVTIFRRDLETGLLTPGEKKIEVVAPVCLHFIKPGF